MLIKHKEIEINADDPFKECKLNRKKYADVLTGLVGSYSDGFVLAINNKWGTGKTTFIKMWNQELMNQGFRTMYFNAWENDFDSNPLVALLAELKTLTNNSNNTSFDSLMKKGAVFAQNGGPELLKGIAQKYAEAQGKTSKIEDTRFTIDKLKNEIEEYTAKKKGLIDFRVELERFVEENNNDKPIVFIVDELDRCRPNYAVEVLEQIKHFFSVKGIVFVLSIDKIQLGNAVRGFYGSELINSDEYLRRFIDLEYIIPTPEKNDFSKYLYEYFEFKAFFGAEIRKGHHMLRDDAGDFLRFSVKLFEKANLSLRQIEKIFAHARLGLNAVDIRHYLFPSLYILLIYVKDLHPEVYKALRERQETPQRIIEMFKPIFPKNLLTGDVRMFVYTEALLIYTYNNYYAEENHNSILMERNADGQQMNLVVKTSFSGQNSTFLSLLISFDREYSSTKITYLMNKIDLMENVVVNN